MSNIHIVPSGSRWAVVPAGNSGRPLSTHSTQAAAIEAGKPYAQMFCSELRIHGTNGRIREARSYGNDPFPPRG